MSIREVEKAPDLPNPVIPLTVKNRDISVAFVFPPWAP